jgi:hypothetical protein
MIKHQIVGAAVKALISYDHAMQVWQRLSPKVLKD